MAGSFEIRDGVGLGTLTGPLSAAQTSELRETFTQWFHGGVGCRNVVLDLGAVEFMDSSGLGVLIAMLKRVSERGGDLVLARLPKKVRLVLEITRAYKIFRIFETVEEALQACR